MKKLIQFCLIILFSALIFSYKVSALEGATYNATFTITLESQSEIGTTMVNESFESKLVIEKLNNLNYIYLSTKEENLINDFKFYKDNYLLGSKEIDNKAVLFVLSEENLHKEVYVSAYVSAMFKTVEFNLVVNNDLSFVSNEILDINRPAEYLPNFSIDSHDFGTQVQGTMLLLPTITAKINNINCDIELKAYYQVYTEKNEVELLGYNLTLLNVGIYFVEYIASNDTYKDSNDNPTSNSLELKIVVMSDGGVSYAVYTNEDESIELGDYNSVITSLVVLNSFEIEDGEEYNNIKSSLSKVSSNFKVYNINLFDSNENTVSYNSKMLLSIKIPGTYDRSITSLYYYSNDTIVEINSDIYVNKIVSNTHLNGTFIVVEKNINNVNILFILIGIGISLFVISTIGSITTLVLLKKGGSND